MNVYWILTDDDDAEHALEAVSRQLRDGDHGNPKLAESLRTIHFQTEIAHGTVLETERPFFAPAINAFRRALTKALWWYGLPQWGQVSEYQRSATQVIDVLLVEQRKLRARVAALEERLKAAERPGSRGT
ncbi:MAG TPA: hypothetical protein VLJ18_10410 [Thermoanaerobaculia bacterium]|nr:hypothetical protein [Thermoanaerobaculia bacterium]